MKKKRSDKKLAKKIIEALREPAPLNDNPGPMEHGKFKWASSKDRKHDGWSTPRIICPDMKWKEIIENALEPIEEYDDWNTKRDGFRDYFFDSLEDEKDMKQQIKKQIKIRKAKKQKKCQHT